MHFAALILAAGSSRRMGPANKLLLPLAGRPLIRHVLEAVQASRVERICVVLGHEAAAVRAVLEPRAAPCVEFVTNTDYRGGLSSSLRCGLRRLGDGFAGVAVCLGDMPRITACIIDALCDGLVPGDYAVVPVRAGQWGNPALLSAEATRDAGMLTGDRGARALLRRHAAHVREVPVSSDAILRDIDRRQDLGLS